MKSATRVGVEPVYALKDCNLFILRVAQIVETAEFLASVTRRLHKADGDVCSRGPKR